MNNYWIGDEPKSQYNLFQVSLAPAKTDVSADVFRATIQHPEFHKAPNLKHEFPQLNIQFIGRELLAEYTHGSALDIQFCQTILFH
jgi:hypothetical protein